MIIFREIPIALAASFLITVIIVQARRKFLQEKGQIPVEGPPISRWTRAFLIWHFFMSSTMILHSCLMLLSPDMMVRPHHPSESLIDIFKMDKMAFLNAIHGVFVIAAAFRFNETKKSNYWYILFIPHIMLTGMHALGLLLAVVRFLRFGFEIYLEPALAFWQFLISANCLFWTFRVYPEIQDSNIANKNTQEINDIAENNRVINQPNSVLITSTFQNDPSTLSLRKFTIIVICSEIIFFGFYLIALGSLRFVGALTGEPVGFLDFLHGMVGAYTSILHRGVIVGWGFHGARNGSSEPLMCYWLANTLSGALSLAEVVPLSRAAFLEPKFSLSLAVVGIQAIIQLYGAYLAKQLCNKLVGRETKNAPFDLSASTHLRSSKTAGWTLSFAYWWHFESAVFIALQLYSPTNRLADITAVALNYGLHGCAILLLSHYRSQERASYAKMANRMRFYLTFYFMFTLLSFSEVISLMYAITTLLYVNPSLLIFLVLAVGRLVISVGAMSGFYSLLQINKQKQDLESRKDSSPVEHIAPPPPLEAQTSPQSNPQLDLETPELGAKTLSTILFIFCGLLVTQESSDYTALFGNLPFSTLFSSETYASGNPNSAHLAGFHSPAYGILFHFCFILTGYSVLGVRLRNAGHLNFTLLSYHSIAFISGIALIVMLFYSFMTSSIILYITGLFITSIFLVSTYDITLMSDLYHTIVTKNIPAINKIW